MSRADQARDRIKAFVRANVGPLTPEDRATVLDEIVKWADEWVWDLCTGQEKEKPDGPPAP